jgi:hypothetical protein
MSTMFVYNYIALMIAMISKTIVRSRSFAKAMQPMSVTVNHLVTPLAHS